MGYFTTNFLPLQFTTIIIITSLIVIAILFKMLTRCTVHHWKKANCRKIGIHLPKEDLFRKLVFRIFIQFFLEILLSATSCLLVLDSLDDDFGNSEKLDWLSSIFAILYSVICFPVLLHMLYVNLIYYDFLEEPDIKLALGHYYVDIKTNSRYKSVMHLVYFFRRIMLVSLILFLGFKPEA